MRALALALLLSGACLPAAETRLSGNAELWGYATGTERAADSPLNPDNRVAELSRLAWTGEARANLRLDLPRIEGVLRPRLVGQQDAGGAGSSEAYLGQAFARIRLDDALVCTGGRDLLTWGPGNFRSPSHPIYYDAGRSNPLRDVSGVDLLRLNWTRGRLSLMLARVLDAGHLDRSVTPGRLTLGKVDLRASRGLVSVVLATPVWGAPFLGGYAQATPDDAWLVYGEIGSGRRPHALELDPAASGPPFALRTPSGRHSTVLLGASYTLGNGQSIALEGLRDGHGLNRRDEARFFARAGDLAGQYHATPEAGLLAALAQGVGAAPVPLGQSYASILWQSNPQEAGCYWRLSGNASLQDGSCQVLGYGEKSLSGRFTGFCSLTRNLGGARAEFGALVRTSLTLGFKYFAF